MGARSIAHKAGFDHFWRNVRTHSLHDPVAHKRAEVGRFVLSGELPTVRIPSMHSDYAMVLTEVMIVLADVVHLEMGVSCRNYISVVGTLLSCLGFIHECQCFDAMIELYSCDMQYPLDTTVSESKLKSYACIDSWGMTRKAWV